MDVNVITF
jgi:hypothetical protein